MSGRGLTYWVSASVDAVVLAHDVILCIEFKTEDKAHSLLARRQVEDYALDLRDFREASRGGRLAPIVVVPKAPRSRLASTEDSTDPVASVRLANAADLSEVVAEVFECLHCENRDPINAEKWDKSPYHESNIKSGQPCLAVRIRWRNR